MSLNVSGSSLGPQPVIKSTKEGKFQVDLKRLQIGWKKIRKKMKVENCCVVFNLNYRFHSNPASVRQKAPSPELESLKLVLFPT